jgi:hypothetical protein
MSDGSFIASFVTHLTQMEQMDSPIVSVCRPFVPRLAELLRLGKFLSFFIFPSE